MKKLKKNPKKSEKNKIKISSTLVMLGLRSNLRLGKPKKLRVVLGARGLILDPPPPLSWGSLNYVSFELTKLGKVGLGSSHKL